MKRVLRGVGLLALAVVGFAVVSYVMFGDDPAARLKLELEHDITVGATKSRTVPEIEGCTLTLTVSQIDATESVGDQQKLDIPIKALAKASSEPGSGFIEFVLPEGSFAACTDIPGGPCATAQRTELQLNMPAVQNDEQSERVLGWIKELAKSCDS